MSKKEIPPIAFEIVKFFSHDGEEEYPMWGIITDDLANGYIIGEWAEVTNLYKALRQAIEADGEVNEVDSLDERLGHPWLSAPEAARYAEEKLDISISSRAIQYACERGEIVLAVNEGGWRFPLRKFRNWLGNRPKPGPKKK